MDNSSTKNYLNTFFNVNKTSNFQELEEFYNYGFEIKNQGFIVIALRVDSYYNLINNAISFCILKHDLLSIANDAIGSKFKCAFCEYKDDFYIIMNIKPNENIFQDMLAELKDQVKERLSCTISIGLSSFHSPVDELETACKEALYALDYRFFLGEDSIISLHGINKEHKSSAPYPADIERLIMFSINKADKIELEAALNAFSAYLEEESLNRDCIVKMYKTLLFSLHHRLSEDKLDGDMIIDFIDKLNDYGKFLTFNDFKNRFLDFIILIIDTIDAAKKDNKNIQKAIKYISENYDKNLDLQTVADNIYITPSYVSMLFKQSLGINFVDYLHEVRLKKACELLRSPKLKCYEIAYKVGFRDEKYFMQVFKKHFGVTPSQYRNAAKQP